MPWSPPTPADHLDRLRRDAPRFAAADPARFDAAVPGCPGWAVRDLVAHVGMIHGWCAGNVRMLAPMREHVDVVPPATDDELGPWAGEQAAALLEVLAATDPDAPMWTHVGAGTAAYWFRRMAHETGVHALDLVDAEAAPADALDPADAADGVDEFLDVYATRRDRHGHLRGAGERLVLHATDAGVAWLVACEATGARVSRGDHGDGTTAGGSGGSAEGDGVPRLAMPAEGLLRLLWGRGTAATAHRSGPPAEAAIVLGRLLATAI